MSGWWLVAYGFALGAAFTAGAVWLPSRSYWRRQLDDLREIRRIEGGIRFDGELTQPLLDDARGAYAAASAAYLPVYPGRGEPDPAWVAWVEQNGWEYDGPKDQYRAAHRSKAPASAPTPEPFPLDRSALPVWGQDAFPAPAVDWSMRWGPLDLPLVPLALLAGWVWPAHYPWWQRLADRVWERLVVFELSGQQVNHAVADNVDRFASDVLEALVGWRDDLAEALDDIQHEASRVWPRRGARYRPKRFYPIQTGPAWPGNSSRSTASPATTPAAATPATIAYPTWGDTGEPSERSPALAGRS